MKERPIVFSAEMVRAILEGRKTMTRRPVKHRHLTNANELDEYFGGGTCEDCDVCFYAAPKGSTRLCVKCPYGKPGDRLWVKETWCRRWDGLDGFAYNDDGNLDPSCVLFRADGCEVEAIDEDGFRRWNKDGTAASPWSSPRFMPRWASRILLEIVSVRVERVQEISRGDAGLEGMCFLSDINWNKVHNGLNVIQKHHWPEENFSRYWDTIHAKKPEAQWDANPWVWVIEFKVAEGRLPGVTK